jgi:hypothetical protein
MRRVQECLDIFGEGRMVLEQEPVRGVWVDLDLRLRDQPGEQVRVVQEDHRVAVAVRDEDRYVDGADPL